MDKATFAVEDYKLKVKYVTDQFSRMWNRFSFLLTLETAIVGIAIFRVGVTSLDVPDKVLAAMAGIVTALFWFLVGAEDRYLVVLYRAQVRDIHDALIHELDAVKYPAAGETEKKYLADTASYVEAPQNFLQFRVEQLSTTRLAAAFPLLVVFLWGIWLTISLWPAKDSGAQQARNTPTHAVSAPR